MWCCYGVYFSHDMWRWCVYNNFDSLSNNIYFIIYIRHHYFCRPSFSGAPICTTIALIEKFNGILVSWCFIVAWCAFMCTISVCPEILCSKIWWRLVGLIFSGFGCCLVSSRTAGVAVVFCCTYLTWLACIQTISCCIYFMLVSSWEMIADAALVAALDSGAGWTIVAIIGAEFGIGVVVGS